MTLWDKLLNRGEALANEIGGAASVFTSNFQQGLGKSNAMGAALDLVQFLDGQASPEPSFADPADGLRALLREIKLTAAAQHRTSSRPDAKGPPYSSWATAPAHVQTSLGAFVESLRRRAELREGLREMAASEASAAPLARLLELRVAEIDRVQRGERAEAERRLSRRDQLRRAFLSLLEESDYAELDGSSLAREIGGIFSLDRAALHAVYDVQHLQLSIRENPHDPLPYIELAEAHQAMARAEAVRAGIRGAVSPWSLLTRGAVEVYRNWKELPKQEIVLARRAVALAATQLRGDPRDIDALEAFGRARLLLGDAQGATKSLKAALVLGPTRHALYFHLTRAYSVTERSQMAPAMPGAPGRLARRDGDGER